jgi:hypothetical protein
LGCLGHACAAADLAEYFGPSRAVRWLLGDPGDPVHGALT